MLIVTKIVNFLDSYHALVSLPTTKKEKKIVYSYHTAAKKKCEPAGIFMYLHTYPRMRSEQRFQSPSINLFAAAITWSRMFSGGPVKTLFIGNR